MDAVLLRHTEEAFYLEWVRSAMCRRQLIEGF
jgi:hypothetical protein